MFAVDRSYRPHWRYTRGKATRDFERVLRYTRVPDASIFENLEYGSTIEEIIEQYDVSREQIKAVLEFAARSLNAPRGIARHLVVHNVSTAEERGNRSRSSR